MAKQVSKLDKAKTALVLDHPFFASILLRRPMVARKDIPILAIDKRGTIYYNPDNLEQFTVPQLVWGMAHECMHYMGQHATRHGHREHKKWNYATDAWINDTLTTASVGEPIEGTVNMPGSKDKTCETIYDELPEGDGGGEGSGSGGQGDAQGDQGGMGDDILDEGAPVTEAEAKQMEAQAKLEVAEAAQAAKMRGKLPGSLAQFIADFLESKTPWYEILERHMVGLVANDQTWSRPNRRFLKQAYLPSVGKTPTMGTLICQVDVSGSITKAELAAYNGHLSRIIEQCSPEKVHVLYVDTRVQRHDEFEQGEEVSLQFFSGGGTHMPEGFNYISERGLSCDAFVCLTDGYTDFGQDPGYPVIWCISSNVQAPWGENVHFELNA